MFCSFEQKKGGESVHSDSRRGAAGSPLPIGSERGLVLFRDADRLRIGKHVAMSVARSAHRDNGECLPCGHWMNKLQYCARPSQACKQEAGPSRRRHHIA